MNLHNTTELAKARNRAAAERTLVTWLNICLVPIGAGIACNRIAIALEAAPTELRIFSLAQLQRLQWVGLGVVGLGLSCLGLAIFLYRRTIRALGQQNYEAQPIRQMDLILTVAAVVLVSLMSLISLVSAFWR